jgi:translation initiation factor 3 subunit I
MVRPLLLQYHSRPVQAVKVNKDGDLFLSCSADGKVCLCRTSNGDRVGVYEGHGNTAVKCCDIDLNSKLVVSGGADSRVVFYEAETGEIMHNLDHGGLLKSVEFNQHPTKNTKIVTANDKFMEVPNQIAVWEFDFSDPMNPVCEKTLSITDEIPTKVTKVKWGPFDETLISIHQEGTAYVWNCKDASPCHMLQAHNAPCTSLQFNEERTLMVTTSRDCTVKLWETKGYECIKKMESNRPFNDAAISPLYKETGSNKDPKFHIIAGGGVSARDVTTVQEAGFESVLFNFVNEEEVRKIY